MPVEPVEAMAWKPLGAEAAAALCLEHLAGCDLPYVCLDLESLNTLAEVSLVIYQSVLEVLDQRL